MVAITSLHLDELAALHARLSERHAAFAKRGLKLDMTRGKPSPEQLDLSNALLGILGNGTGRTADGGDGRNYYGDIRGLPEARALFTGILGAPIEQLLVGGNSSLALMHDTIVFALLHGVPDGPGAWARDGGTTFLCPSPGYDRHFALCETFGIRMLPVALTGHGPDMDEVERLVADDASIKGMWCVPKYSNPTGEIYAPETVERLAAMKTAAPDFRLFWDNAYAVHYLTETRHALANVLEACARHGNANRAFVYGSTSKVTFAGAGLALFAGAPANMSWLTGHMSFQTIGPDKLNQLRHVMLLRDEAGILALMEQHRRLIAPKFQRVLDVLEAELGGTGIARWTKPDGGYFISLDVPGNAKRTVTLAKEAGIALVPAGRTFPYGRDPADSNIRLAPTFPSVNEVGLASEGVALSALLAAVERLRAERTGR